MTSPSSSDGVGTARQLRPWLFLLVALAVVTTAYSNALEGPFVWDDRMLVESETLARDLAPAAHFQQSFWRRSATADADTTYFRPLTTLTYAIDWARSGGRPGAFHFTNVLLHLTVCCLVFAAAMQGGATPVAAGFATALFGTLPRLTECVTWISGRTDVLATLFGLAAFLLYLWRHSGKIGPWAAAPLFLLGLLSKEVALAALVGVTVVEGVRVMRGERLRSAALCLAPMFLALAAYAALRLRALYGVRGAPMTPIPFRALFPFQALGQYVLMAVDPLRPRLQIGILGELEPGLVTLGALALVAIVVLAVALVRRGTEPMVLGLTAAALAGLALVLHVVRIRLNVVAADRFMYLPAAALAIALAVGARRLHGRPAAIAALCAGACLCAFVASTLQRNLDWADEVRLWEVATDTTPRANLLPENELATALARAGRLEEAIQHYRALLARAVPEQQVSILSNIGASLSELGRFEEARTIFEKVLALMPSRPAHHFNLAMVEARLLRFEEADRELAQALRLMPEYADAARMRQLVAEARSDWATLPPERAGETTAVRVRRAEFWVRLAVPRQALPIWEQVLMAPDAPQPKILEATAYLVSYGSPDRASNALARARTAGVAPEELVPLEAVLADRVARAALH